MSVLIVIVNYGTAQMTLRATETAVVAARELGEDWSIALVDNKSPDDSVAVLRAQIDTWRAAAEPGWDRVELLESPLNGGFGAGCNFAIRPALAGARPPDYVYLLNSDAFPEPGAILALRRYMDQHADVAVSGSLTRGVDGAPHNTAFRFHTLASEFEDAMRLGLITSLLQRWRVPIGALDCTTDVDWVAGASMMLRSTALQQVGLFDENFFLYFEETELCLRTKRAGWRTVHVVESRVAHVGGGTTGLNRFRARVPRYWLDSRYYYFLKSHGYAYVLCATILRGIGLAIWQLRRFVQRKEDSHPPWLLSDLVRHFIAQRPRELLRRRAADPG